MGGTYKGKKKNYRGQKTLMVGRKRGMRVLVQIAL